MPWLEPDAAISEAAAGPVTDLSFAIRCRSLPVDHARDLADAVAKKLPWIHQESRVAIHSIRVAESANGWQRPDGEGDGVLQLSRRTRMILRLSSHLVERASELCGCTLDLGDYRIKVGETKQKPLTAATTLLAHAVVVDPDEEETRFTNRLVSELNELPIVVPKMLCGRQYRIRGAAETLTVCSVLLADLSPTDSIHLQQQGIGDHQLLGCGIFVPHKGISAVH